MQLSRESILRMFEGSGSGGSGGGAGSSQLAAMLQGYATQSWVDENYVGIEFFNRLFRVHGADDAVIVPNDLETTIQNIEARFGLWTESFLSALGLNSGGGGGGSVSYLNDLLDVSITNPTVGEGLIYDGTRWVNGPIGGGGTGSVESVGLSMPTGFSVTGSPVTSSGTLAVGFASGYSLPPTSKQAQWDAAYSWGDHSLEGYATQSWVNAKGYTTNAGTVTSVRMTVPAGLTVTGSPITTSGTLAISLGTGYSIPTTAKQSQWDTAYGWGNHADAGYATQTWVGDNYVSIEFFNRLFRVHGADDAVIVPNDLETTIQNIEARFGLWTESFLSALGLNSSGSGGGSASYLDDLLDVNISSPATGDGLVFDGTRWVNGPVGGGGSGSVERVALTMPTGFSVAGSPVTSSGTLAVTFASGYSLPTTVKQNQWDAAYGWGDHSVQGYATQTWVNSMLPSSTDINNWNTAYSNSHTHSNKSVLDGITSTKTNHWDTAYGWGNHADAGYATQTWVNSMLPTATDISHWNTAYSNSHTHSNKSVLDGITSTRTNHWDSAYGWGNHADAGYATQTALAAATSRIGTLEGYFSDGSAKTALRLADNDTHYAWGQPFWQNGVPKNIGSASARANISYAGSVDMGYTLSMEYYNGIHDPAIYMKSSKTETNLLVLTLSNSATSDHSGDHLAIGYGTSAFARLPIRMFGREFLFNYTTNTKNNGLYVTEEAMRIGYRTLGTTEEPAVYVRKHLMIGNGAGDYFPVTYDSANNALCFTGNIYATGGVSALGFSSTQNGGALINGALEVQSSATLRGNTTIGGNTSIGGTLGVTGATTLAQLRATGTVTGTLSVTGACSFGGRVVINNDADDIAIVWNGREYYLNVQAMINNGFLS